MWLIVPTFMYFGKCLPVLTASKCFSVSFVIAYELNHWSEFITACEMYVVMLMPRIKEITLQIPQCTTTLTGPKLERWMCRAKCQSTHRHHRYTLHTAKHFSPIKFTCWGSPHYPRSSDFEISQVKHSLLKTMLIMFSLSLSFETLPLSSLHLAPLSGPVCSALHKSGKHTLTPKYTTADDLCYVYICAGMEKVVEFFF